MMNINRQLLILALGYALVACTQDPPATPKTKTVELPLTEETPAPQSEPVPDPDSAEAPQQ